MQTYNFDTVIIGSGAAAYACAYYLLRGGKKNIAIVTEGKNIGTSRNAGSDKQTYYKLSVSSLEDDNVMKMAADLMNYGGVDGDIALAQAAGSVRCFMNLANLGVPFPENKYGEFIGYKTDHSENNRATSAGPLTSKFMTEILEKEVMKEDISYFDNMTAFKIITKNNKVGGVVAVNKNADDFGLTLFNCNNLVIAVGGESGAYFDSVFPFGHTGSAGMLADAGLEFANVNHWQYGIASIKFRWNLSGSFQQVIPKYVSIDENGAEFEFLYDADNCKANILDRVFLKGYQWPFDARKIDGSSYIDMLVIEEIKKGRRVYLDFRSNPKGLQNGFNVLSEEAYDFLENADILFGTPIERLKKFNPFAVKIYSDHGIDIENELLEISVSAQHQNGGARVDCNWETSVQNLFVIGEAAGTFGAYRPGGSALNAGQVGALRTAEKILNSDEKEILETDFNESDFIKKISPCLIKNDRINHIELREKYQKLMSKFAGAIRDVNKMKEISDDIQLEIQNYFENTFADNVTALLKTYDILLSIEAFLKAFIFSAEKIGSYGGSICISNGDVLKINSKHINDLLISNEICCFVKPRPIPKDDVCFEEAMTEKLNKYTLK